MPNIQLKAQLQAYSRAPYYSDYIREAPKDNLSYIRKNGEWVVLDEFTKEALKEFQQQIQSLEDQVGTIDIYSNDENIVFVLPSGESRYITFPALRVDNITIGADENGTLYQIDVPDKKTINIVDETYAPAENGFGAPRKTSGKLRADALWVGKDSNNQDLYITGISLQSIITRLEKNVSDLENTLQGTGGYLDPYRFYYDGTYNLNNVSLSNLHPSVKDGILTKYAKDQLNGVTPKDQTKIKDLYENKIWVFSNGTWVDNGEDSVVIANNSGVLGSVKGVTYNPNDVTTKFKISIDTDNYGRPSGIMSVNGLEDEFGKVIYKSDLGGDGVQGNDIVVRTSDGTIKANDPIEDDDVVTQGAFNDIIEKSMATKSEIESLCKEIFD